MRIAPKLGWWAAAALMAACGGKAIVDGKPGAGAGGHGGATSSSVTSAGGTLATSAPDGPGSMTIAASAVSAIGSTGFTGATTNASVSSASSTGSGPVDPCPSACKYASTCSQQPANCVGLCAMQKPTCIALHQDYLNCVLKNQKSNTCAAIPACKSALDAYLMCIGPSMGGCGADASGNCSCSDALNAHKYSTQCSPSGNGTFSCTCAVDGQPMGKCFGNAPMGPIGVCGLDSSCCASLYFVAYW